MLIRFHDVTACFGMLHLEHLCSSKFGGACVLSPLDYSLSQRSSPQQKLAQGRVLGLWGFFHASDLTSNHREHQLHFLHSRLVSAHGKHLHLDSYIISLWHVGNQSKSELRHFIYGGTSAVKYSEILCSPALHRVIELKALVLPTHPRSVSILYNITY